MNSSAVFFLRVQVAEAVQHTAQGSGVPPAWASIENASEALNSEGPAAWFCVCFADLSAVCGFLLVSLFVSGLSVLPSFVLYFLSLFPSFLPCL